MSYNLQSLITILKHLLNPRETRWHVYQKERLQSLLKKAASLQQILENVSGPRIESLEGRIRDATHEAEDVIEGHMVDQVLSRSQGVCFTFYAPDLKQLMKEFGSAREQVVEIMMERNTKNMSIDSSSSGAAFLQADLPSSKKGVVVGFDEDLLQLKDRLTGYESKLEIVPIVGMGGIGKTTIARKLYEDPLILSHFDICAWTTISQDMNVRAVILGLLCRPDEKPSNELTESTDSELKQILYERLYDRRYLVVLDDMWSTGSWDVIRSCFPPNNNGSRIVLTTRESEVAENVGTQSCQHRVQLLQEFESWKLLCQIVFGGDDCPDIDALEVIGRKIAGDCGGLPLAIKAIGGLLSKAERSRDIWESIGKDISVAKANDDGLSNVLSLSYNHLPNHLKPCFLYFGAFPEDYEIKGSRLVRMWMAEGFLKSNGDKSLEEEAEGYLRSLVERNLILVTRKKTSGGKAVSYGMHDLMRDLCMKKAREEKFFHVQNERVDEVTFHKHYKVRRVSVHTTSYGMDEDVDVMSLARSYICTALNMEPEILSPAFLLLRLLRVLDVLDIQFEDFPREILQLVNLRYLAFSCFSNIPGEISRLLNLQTLIGKIDGNYEPSEIWEMCELKHLKLDTIIYIEEGYLKFDMYEKLQRISTVRCNRSLVRMGFFKTIPNIKKLGIYWEESPCSSKEEEEVDLRHLHKLQTLRCQSDLNEDGCRFLPTIRFPPTLRKLTLFKCVIFPRVLTTLCALPNLEVLKISQCEFENGVFEATEEGDVFRSLQYLLLDELSNLVHWRADETNFPTLRQLFVLDCTALDEIPSGIGDIPTLHLIDVYQCNSSVEASAKQIQKVQQEDFENYQLQLITYDSQ